MNIIKINKLKIIIITLSLFAYMFTSSSVFAQYNNYKTSQASAPSSYIPLQFEYIDIYDNMRLIFSDNIYWDKNKPLILDGNNSNDINQFDMFSDSTPSSIYYVGGNELTHHANVVYTSHDTLSKISFFPSADATLTPVKYSLTFLKSDNSQLSQINVYKKFNYYNMSLNVPLDPQKNNHTFEGWYIDQAFTTPFTFDMPITSDTVVYPKFTPNKYSLSFDLNGANGIAPSSISLEYNSYATKPNDPTRDYYKFSGWNTKANGQGINWNFTQNTMPNNNLILYAQWTKIVETTSNKKTPIKDNRELPKTGVTTNIIYSLLILVMSIGYKYRLKK